LAIYLFVRSVGGQRLRLKAYVAVLLSVAALAGTAGVAQYFSGSAWTDDPNFMIVLGRVRSHLTMASPNNFTAYLAGAVPLALAAAEQSRRRWLYLAIAGVVAASLICTCSRSGWIGAVAGVTAVLLLRRRRLLVPAATFLAILGLEVAAFSYDVSRYGTAPGLSVAGTDALSANPLLLRCTDSFRADLWRLGVAMVEAHPWLGVGLGNTGLAMPEYFQRAHVSSQNSVRPVFSSTGRGSNRGDTFTQDGAFVVPP
jgi:O-antigen ligase